MLVHLTSNNESLKGYKSFSDVLSFSRGVGDNEATSIICENFLCNFNYSDLPKVVALIVKKMRLRCELIISEKDFSLISKHIFRESVDIEGLNHAIFSDMGTGIKSILTSETIESLLNPYELSVISKGFDETVFTITLERLK